MTMISTLSAPEATRAMPASAAASVPRGGEATGAPATATAAPALAANPALRMDAELGLVVLEFRDAQGEVTASAPTERELDAYRRAARTGQPRPDAAS